MMLVSVLMSVLMLGLMGDISSNKHCIPIDIDFFIFSTLILMTCLLFIGGIKLERKR